MPDGQQGTAGMDRRGFFRIVGVSGAAAAAAGCGKTTEAILPYVIPAEHIVPGGRRPGSRPCAASARRAAGSWRRAGKAGS